MATISTTSIISKAGILLQDATNVRWPQAELLDWLNDGQREAALLKPNVCVKNVDFFLLAGTKQTIPADGVTLVDVTRNTGGNAVRIITREILDAQIPDWHAFSRASAKTLHYCYSDNDPKNFYVYPPSPGGNSLEIIYAASPANATPGGVISIDDIYASALLDYIMYRGYSKDTEYAENADSALKHYAAFKFALTGKAQSEQATDPNGRKFGNANA